MPPLQFCANLTWLFTELPELSQRIYAAAAAGFRAVEAAWPYDEELLELQRARDATGVEMVLINTPPGNLRAGDLGLGAVPGREQEFRQGLEQAVQYAQALQCKRIHLMAGRVPLGSNRADVAQDMERIFIQNLTYAADLLSKKGITGLIEPINTRITDPAYFLDSPHHGHVQVAQVPERNEPDTPGELNFSYLWDVLERHHYQGFVGCEYHPLGGTAAGLGWLKEYWTRKEARED
ncbi:putative hydroxypyruvate isomerase isoform X3 [Eucyclogobius newberryi]|uniref:putative hydroxypyruvate isomerase isoform X3 n=1 Tax=Eucyclogobius newberryi TaxID=166745 RepID=UPI003B5A1B58